MTESFRSADGLTLQYHRLGDGPLLVCHPGGPGFSSRYFAGDLGGLDKQTVTRFVENGARLLQGNGADVNRFIHNATGLLSTLRQPSTCSPTTILTTAIPTSSTL